MSPTKLSRQHNDTHSIERELFSVSTGHPSDPRPAFSAKLIAHASIRNILDTQLHSTPSHVSPYDCFPIVHGYGDLDSLQSLELRHYPTGKIADSMRPSYARGTFGIVRGLDYRPADCLFAYAVDTSTIPSHLIAFRDQSKIYITRFPRRHGQQRTLARTSIGAKVIALALAPTSLCLAATQPGETTIFQAREGTDQLAKVIARKHPDDSMGYATRFSGEYAVLTGTRDGNVYKWDARVGTERPVWSVEMREEGNVMNKVCDMYVSSSGVDLYVSAASDVKGSLVTWDMRSDGSQGPNRVFKEYCNCLTAFKFDVNESGTGGLLAAGGTDRVIRLWSASRAGTPLEVIPFGASGYPIRLRFMGWDGRGASTRPGLYVQTYEGPFILETGHQRTELK